MSNMITITASIYLSGEIRQTYISKVDSTINIDKDNY